MTLELIDALFFTVFEGCLFFAGIATTYFISKRTNKNFSTPELILSWILFSILFSVLITSIFSFTKFNGSLQYVISSILLVGFIHIILKGNFVQYYEYIRLTFFQVISESFNWKILLIILFLIPVVIMMMLPISDSDSIQFIEYMLRWVNNETIPYDNWVHYTSVWELTYLPSLIITQSENYVWYNSLKPLIIMGLGTYLILENLKLPRKISWLAIFSSILYYPMWAGWEHIGTFKDDYIMSAGLILLVLATLKLSKGNFNLLYKIFVIVGFGFATIKFAGLFIGIFALILFLIFNRKRISRSKKKSLLWFSVLIIIFMSVTGHYYVNNLVQFGSPVYPFVFKVGEFGFDGKLDYRNTSIIDNLDDKRLWDILLPSSVWRGGLIFPIILVFGTIGMIGLVSYLGFRYLKTKLIESKILYLSIFILITWLIFLNSFVSAGFTPSTFDHIQNLNSTRYAIATIILSEVFLIYVLYRIKIPELVLLGILGINVAFRLWLFYSNFPSYLESFVIILPVSVIVGVFVLQKFLKKSYQKTTLVILIGILLFYFSPEVIEFNRTAWLPWWYDVISVVHELPKSSIFIISDMDSGKDMPHRYPVYGKDFRHSLTIGTVNELIENINNNQKVPEYVVELCWKQYNCSTEFTQLSSKLVEYNYQTIARDGNNAILLKFSE